MHILVNAAGPIRLWTWEHSNRLQEPFLDQMKFFESKGYPLDGCGWWGNAGHHQSKIFSAKKHCEPPKLDKKSVRCSCLDMISIYILF